MRVKNYPFRRGGDGPPRTIQLKRQDIRTVGDIDWKLETSIFKQFTLQFNFVSCHYIYNLYILFCIIGVIIWLNPIDHSPGSRNNKGLLHISALVYAQKVAKHNSIFIP
jgi:hypothetical protein